METIIIRNTKDLINAIDAENERRVNTWKEIPGFNGKYMINENCGVKSKKTDKYVRQNGAAYLYGADGRFNWYDRNDLYRLTFGKDWVSASEMFSEE